MFLEQLGEFLGHCTAEFLGVDNCHGAAIVARHIMTNTDGDQLYRSRPLLSRVSEAPPPQSSDGPDAT